MTSHVAAADAQKVGGFSGLYAFALKGVKLFHDREEAEGMVLDGGG